ncbi:MAG: adenosylhomocysteinase [Clostridia bacterium]
MSEIADIRLKEEGHQRIAWVARHMPVLSQIGERFEREKPFTGLRIALSIHLEAKTAYLVQTLARGGAQMSVTGSNPLSTQDAVCAALVDDGITVHAAHGVDRARYLHFLTQTLSVQPHIVIDDGADLVDMLLHEGKPYARCVWGACEETTSGVQRLHGWQRAGKLCFPVLAVNDARCKSYFDNTYGTGQSVWDGIMRTTNLQVNGKTVVVAGYGYCGRGVAQIARGLGAQVIVTEIDPVKSILAVMDGYRAMPMAEAAALGDIFVTVTGCCDVLRPEHFAQMKDDAIVCNAGHFNLEIDVEGLAGMAISHAPLRRNMEGYCLSNGRTIALIAEGGLVNIAAGDGHPAEIMDMSFALQALAAEYVAKNHDELQPGVHAVPEAIDRRVAQLKLAAMGGGYDRLNEKQAQYLQGH